MRYGQIRKYDVANGPGIRTSFFVTGCNHHCPGCFNQEYQSFTAGQEWTQEETDQVIEDLSLEEVEGLSILGGEPFDNTKDLLKVVQSLRAKSQKSIWIYSGYTYEELIQDPLKKELLDLCQVLVDGLFIEEKKDLRLRFRGSSNQRIIDLHETRRLSQIVLWIEK